MIESIRNWIFCVVAAALILTVIYALAGGGKLRSIVAFTGGTVLLLVILRPLTRLDIGWDLSYERYSREIEKQIEMYQEENLKRTETIIAERLAAYISDKGLTLGVVCHPAVETRLRDGVPYPDRVTLDVPWDAALSDYIETELGIAPQCQIWQER
ncbi:MAG: hypothetical protein J5482_05725 [Oscillospiraceae bacterium]|nr:hypothetical protein [Oscillospiraceae bacterium]